jgi:hypothetical protein
MPNLVAAFLNTKTTPRQIVIKLNEFRLGVRVNFRQCLAVGRVHVRRMLRLMTLYTGSRPDKLNI